MTFEVRPFEARTAIWWHSRREDIDFEPPYQRRGQVWDGVRRAYLIDSMINEFDMPKLYFADFSYFNSPLNVARRRFAVIDGKQRLAAIFGFFEDEVPLAEDFVFREDPEIDVAGMTYSALRAFAPEISARVENFNMPIMSVITDDQELVQELFVRLNSGKPLTASERRSAMTGFTPQLVRQIVATPFFQHNVAFADRGGAKEQAAAKLLLLEYVKEPIDLKRNQLDSLYGVGVHAGSTDELEIAAADVMQTLQSMSGYFVERDPLLRTQGQLPVYYILMRQTSIPNDLRNGLEAFHDLRRRALRVVAGAVDDGVPDKLLPMLLQYASMMRNPNDANAIFGMSEILANFFGLAPAGWRWH